MHFVHYVQRASSKENMFLCVTLVGNEPVYHSLFPPFCVLFFTHHLLTRFLLTKLHSAIFCGILSGTAANKHFIQPKELHRKTTCIPYLIKKGPDSHCLSQVVAVTTVVMWDCMCAQTVYFPQAISTSLCDYKNFIYTQKLFRI
jgi:hypothetical protein